MDVSFIETKVNFFIEEINVYLNILNVMFLHKLIYKHYNIYKLLQILS